MESLTKSKNVNPNGSDRTAALDATAPGPPLRLVRGLVCFGLAIVIVAACAQATPSGKDKSQQPFLHALAMRGCTQEDAPALEIYLTRSPFSGEADPLAPYIRFEIASHPDESVAPASFKLAQLRRNAGDQGRIVRAELVEPGHDPIWLSGTVTLSETTSERISGRYKLTTAAGRSIDGKFLAKFSKRTATCG